MKIYTKTGDSGDTGLLGGVRVRKDHPRVEAVGDVDELNSLLGLAAAGLPVSADSPNGSPDDLPTWAELSDLLHHIQHELFNLGAELARLDGQSDPRWAVDPEAVLRLEQAVDRFERLSPPLSEFILPGGSSQSSTLHLARSVCRRAERRLVTLSDHGPGPVRPDLLIYLNRLSDLLFTLARASNSLSHRPDVPWRREG